MRVPTVILALIAGLGFGFAEPRAQGAAPASPASRASVAAFLKQHCVHCHGPEQQEGDVALHELDAKLANNPGRWRAVVERLSLNEMPPPAEPRPDPRAVQQAIAWIRGQLAEAGIAADDADYKLRLPGYGNRVDHAALFSGQFTGPAASPARLWRMSPHIYLAYLPQITKVSGAPSGRSAHPLYSKMGQPFSLNSGGSVQDYAALYAIDEPSIQLLLRNARQIVEFQTTQTNRNATDRRVKEFLPLLNPQQAPTEEEIGTAIRKQFQLALFRDPTDEELDRMLHLAAVNIRDAGQEMGAKSTLATVLLLPEALYRDERGQGAADETGRRLLGPRELAYAISFALTDDRPDAELLQAAESGWLASAEDVRREVRRLLDDPQLAKPRIARFFEEYFEYPAAANVFKDLPFRATWRPQVLIDDTRRLIQYVLDQDRDVLKQLLTTNKSYINYGIDEKTGAVVPARNEQLNGFNKNRNLEIADLYGLPKDWQWTDEQPVELPVGERAGILTQPSWLAAFATNNENHPIRRGKWIRERLLGGTVPDVPITVDARLPEAPDKTLRQRMEVTADAYCWRCHRQMNPLGLALESYDYFGRFRRTEKVVDPDAPPPRQGPQIVYREIPVDSTGWIESSGDPQLDGAVSDAVELMRRLADSPRVRQVFVRHAFRYWMGRNETLDDSPTLIAADRAYVQSQGSMKALVTALLTSDSFLYRRDAP